MSHQLKNINFPAARLQGGPAGAPLTSEGVRAILRRHRVCYDFWLQRSANRGVTTYSGYMLRLCGVNDAEHFWGECHVPSCQHCHRTYDDLRKVAEWLIPQNEQGDHCEIEPFDVTSHIVQRQGQPRKEIGVTINVLHRPDVNAPSDAWQWLCMKDMLVKLDHLGVHDGVFPAAEAAAS
jgi:hypothetical protein